MTKTDYLMKFRRHATAETLEKVFEHMRDNIPESELAEFFGAYDHRKAELKMQRLYDKVPASVWKIVD